MKDAQIVALQFLFIDCRWSLERGLNIVNAVLLAKGDGRGVSDEVEVYLLPDASVAVVQHSSSSDYELAVYDTFEEASSSLEAFKWWSKEFSMESK